MRRSGWRLVVGEKSSAFIGRLHPHSALRAPLFLPMPRLTERTCTLPYYAPQPLTSLPLLYDREHLFPYTSYGDTARTPVPRPFRMLVLENAALRVEVAPELGGRVYSLFDRRIGREVLFRNPVVKPVRILPIWAFVSGGIEFNFPIAHSPTSIATVGCRTGQVADYAFVRVGEREAQTGMEWVVELGLCGDLPVLVQRTAVRNRSGADRPWMWWTIAAVRSTEGTEFVHPPHRVLVHDDRVAECDWPGAGLNWDRNLRQMTALFWKPGSAERFGAFHHDLECGLMHVADPATLPGKKVWSYGHGAHRAWAQATTEGGLAYAEIESGPLIDQSEKARLRDGAERTFTEYWVPVQARADFERWPFLAPTLPPMTDPWLGWGHSAWQSEWEAFRAGDGALPTSTVVTALPLEASLRRALERGDARAAEPLALWLAFHGRPHDALAVLAGRTAPRSRRLTGLLLWKAQGQAAAAVSPLAAGPLEDPMAVVELDALFAELGLTAERAALLARGPAHRRVVERQADLALASGQPAETLRLLAETAWPLEHQRYVRTALWRRARAALGETTDPVPAWLGEDNLAPFGAYWADLP